MKIRLQETASSADTELIVEEPIGTTTLKYQIVQVLRDNILAGKLSPGQRLNESQLARTLGMSRIPVREALQRLEEQGLVVNVQRKGMFVVRLTEEEVQKINSLRLILESEALILCRARLTTEIERTLTDLVERWETEVPTWPQSQAAELDLEIHRTIWAGSGNEYLVKTMSSLIVPLFAYRVIRKLNVETQRWGHNSHLPLLDYVVGKSKLPAEQVMLDHLRFGWDTPEQFSSLGLKSQT